MATPTKFTTEELSEIKRLRDENTTITGRLGQLEVELILARQAYEKLVKEKEDIGKKFIEFQGQEKELVENLNKTYGAGSVNLESGEFTPIK